MEPEFSVGQRVYIDCYDCEGVVVRIEVGRDGRVMYFVKVDDNIWNLWEEDLEGF